MNCYQSYRLIIPLFWLFLSTYVQAVELRLGKATPEFEAQIVELFSENHCDEVRKLFTPELVNLVRPNILAIIASCDPPGQDAQQLFAKAQERSPSGDLIAVLHARYTSKTNPSAAEPLWQNALKLSRNPFLRKMALEYLSGNINPADEENLSLTSSMTLNADVQLGSSLQTNPKDRLAPDPITRASGSMDARFNLNAQRWYRWGSITGTLDLEGEQFFSAHALNLLQSELESRISVHAGPNEDVVFRPFGGYDQQGGSPRRSFEGLGVLGIAYRSDYKQSVQCSVLSDALYPNRIENQQGAHYRFVYDWEIFPPSWFIDVQVFIEHVVSAQDFKNAGDAVTVPTTITYSHTDAGVEYRVQHDLKWFAPGITTRFVSRQDSDASVYANKVSGQEVSKRRQDYELAIRPNLTVPLFPYTQLVVWYEWDRIYSNMTSVDYLDRGYLNQSVGFSLRAALSNY